MNTLLLHLLIAVGIATGNVALPPQNDPPNTNSDAVCQNGIELKRGGVIYGVDVNMPLMNQIRRTA